VLVNAFLGVAAALPKTVMPAGSEATRQCSENFAQLTAPLKDDPGAESIEEVGKVVVRQIEEIARSNKSALDDCDATMKDVITTVAAAIKGFKGHGERHGSSLTRMADSFEALARVEDVGELRRRLREDVTKLRVSVEEMRQESEASAGQFEASVAVFQQRLEAARKGGDFDRLTLLGSRRMGERHLQRIGKHAGAACVLFFDIDDFKKINERYGAPFADKLLQALAHLLRESYPEEGALGRWGPDEFLAIAEGSLTASVDRCRGICQRFANSNYVTYVAGRVEKVSASVSWGAAQAGKGESVESLCMRAQDNLEQNRRGVRR
jgi:diguanylate cyclase (GGDEF)-like protein